MQAKMLNDNVSQIYYRKRLSRDFNIAYWLCVRMAHTIMTNLQIYKAIILKKWNYGYVKYLKMFLRSSGLLDSTLYPTEM
jgi:hypothetical protein